MHQPLHSWISRNGCHQIDHHWITSFKTVSPSFVISCIVKIYHPQFMEIHGFSMGLSILKNPHEFGIAKIYHGWRTREEVPNIDQLMMELDMITWTLQIQYEALNENYFQMRDLIDLMGFLIWIFTPQNSSSPKQIHITMVFCLCFSLDVSFLKFSTLTGGAGKAELDGKGFMKLCEDWLGRVGLRGQI